MEDRIAHGILALAMAIRLRLETRYRAWLGFSAVIGFLLAVIVISGPPGTATSDSWSTSTGSSRASRTSSPPRGLTPTPNLADPKVICFPAALV